jgi:hypothetical protein
MTHAQSLSPQHAQLNLPVRPFVIHELEGKVVVQSGERGDACERDR